MINKEDVTDIGQFQKTHALKGELNAILDFELPFVEDEIPIIIDIEGILVPFYIDSLRPKGATSFLIKISGIDTEKEASEFVNKSIYVLKSDLRQYNDEEGEYADDLIGFEVIDSNNCNIGIIKDLDLTTENSLFIIENGEKNILIPIVDEFILKIDDEKRIVYMNIPEGLLDIN